MDNALYYLLAFFSALVIIGCLGVLFLFLNQLRRKDEPRGHAQTDLANMMILFQTMRDVVSEQKALAREFNASLDRKVETIRELVSAAQEEREELRKSQQAISKLLVQAKDDFIPGPPDTDLDETRAGLAPAEGSPERGPERGPTLRAIGGLEKAPDPLDDLIDSWMGAEFVGPETAALPSPAAVEAPTAPEDAAAARDAFRTLLDIDSGSSAEAAPLPDTSPEPHPRAGGPNGRPRLSPLQRRVYEYSDAGMKVGEIAKELGIGKGEIRLIQSLRDDKEGI